MNITCTPDQSAAIIHRWNDLVIPGFQFNENQASMLFDDRLAQEIVTTGESKLEVGRHQAKSGDAETLSIRLDDVTFDPPLPTVEEAKARVDRAQEGINDAFNGTPGAWLTREEYREAVQGWLDAVARFNSTLALPPYK